MQTAIQDHLSKKEYENSAQLVSYASGDGSISFVFQNKLDHNATGLKVTYRDVESYLRADNRFQGWILQRMGPGVIKAYQPVIRVSNDEVEFAGNTYFYTKDGFNIYQVYAEDDLGKTVEVRNENIKSAIAFWLEQVEGYIERPIKRNS